MEEISSKIDYMHFPANSTCNPFFKLFKSLVYEDEEFYGSLYIVYQGEVKFNFNIKCLFRLIVIMQRIN